jgi:hypothetical protein
VRHRSLFGPDTLELFGRFGKSRRALGPGVGKPLDDFIEAIVGLAECGRFARTAQAKDVGIEEPARTPFIMTQSGVGNVPILRPGDRNWNGFRSVGRKRNDGRRRNGHDLIICEPFKERRRFAASACWAAVKTKVETSTGERDKEEALLFHSVFRLLIRVLDHSFWRWTSRTSIRGREVRQGKSRNVHGTEFQTFAAMHRHKTDRLHVKCGGRNLAEVTLFRKQDELANTP